MASARIAVIGAGVIGARHISVLASDPREFTLAAIADPRALVEAVAQQHGTQWFADYREMLDKVRPDGAVVSSPNTLHESMALACIERGIPVLVEKPIANTMEEALRIVDASKAKSVPVLVGHHRRHNPLMRRAKEAIDAGDLGQVTAVVAYSLRRKHDAYYDVAWKREPGGGPILLNGIHEIDNMRMLCGEIDSLVAATANAARGYAVEDTFAATLKFRNGALGTLTISDAVQAPWTWELTAREEPEFAWESEHSCMIGGTKASLAIPTLERWHNERGGGRADPTVRTRLFYKPADPMREELLHFVRVARGEVAPIVSAEEGSRTLACVLAINRSAETSGWVNIDSLYDEGRAAPTSGVERTAAETAR